MKYEGLRFDTLTITARLMKSIYTTCLDGVVESGGLPIRTQPAGVLQQTDAAWEPSWEPTCQAHTTTRKANLSFDEEMRNQRPKKKFVLRHSDFSPFSPITTLTEQYYNCIKIRMFEM